MNDYRIKIEKEAGVIKYVRINFESGDVITLSFENQKLNNGSAMIATLSLPPIVTCKPSVPCAHDCYACKMIRIHPSILVCWKKNLQAIRNHDNWMDAVRDAIKISGTDYVRVHVSGDFFSDSYVNGWKFISSSLPSVKFLAFSKRDDMDLSGFSSNFRIIASDWFGTSCNIPNVPHSIVGQEKEGPIDSIPCTGNCSKCFACWNLRPDQSVYFHIH